MADPLSQKSYWRWSKQDFLPEESFQSWNNYASALSQTWCRFKDRLMSRSDAAAETTELRRQSENDMKRCLTWWDLIWFGFGTVVGAGIFVLTGEEAHDTVGPAIVLSYGVSGFSAMLSVFCYTEFAVEVPVAGGSFAYLRIELGDFAAFIAAGNILLESIVGTAAVSRSWTSYFTSLLNKPENSLRIKTGLKDGYNLLDPIVVVVLAITSAIAISSTRKTSYFNWIASAVHTLVIIFVIFSGIFIADTSNLTPFLPFGAKGIFQAAAIVYFTYAGFDSVATMAEETKNPSTDIPIGLIGSMSIIIVIYCLMALTLSMMQNYKDIDTDAAFSAAFQSVGMKWANLLSISTLFIFMMMAVALLVRRYYVRGVTPRENLLKLVAFLLLIISSSMGILAYWVMNPNGWIGYTITVPIWFLATLGMSLFLTQQRVPRVWGVPLVPWLPSMSIAINIFLMGSLDSSAFTRFGVCTGLMLIYYFFFGLHATYDVAHQ
ncbi:Cationic amino acid transporter [Arachis hypogaea]|nr:Cationic amino acid transporter [Arachis hypogaea]